MDTERKIGRIVSEAKNSARNVGREQNLDDGLLLKNFEENIKFVLTRCALDNPVEARLWAENAIRTLQSVLVYIEDFGDRKGRAPISVELDPAPAHALGLPTPDETSSRAASVVAEQRFGRGRLGLIRDLVVLEAVAAAAHSGSRAASIDSIFQELEKRDLVAKASRPAVVTRLNRMRMGGLLTWQKGSRTIDIETTSEGQELASRLRKRLLTADEVQFVDRKIKPWTALTQAVGERSSAG